MGLNDDADQVGGKFISLNTKGDKFSGAYLGYEERGMMFDGTPVLSKKTGKQRTERLFTFQTDLRDDDTDNGVRLYSAKEGAWKAIAAAIKAVKAANPGWTVYPGDTVEIECIESSVQGKSQAEVSVVWSLNKDREPAPAEPEPTHTPTPAGNEEYGDMEPFHVDLADWNPGVWGQYPKRLLP